mmetsp:Transcript_88972/g.281595  ORF Transcript_88972/g.281595 Transcript_88972/m.281595 type:complete len:1163 (-) Transcript_88972:16-3504(-)
MAWHRALASVLVLLTSVHRLAAQKRGGGRDEVGFVQLTIAAREGKAAQLVRQAAAVERSLNSLLAKRRRTQVKLTDTPLSLLAVNASTHTASTWYKMDDGLLLQKLQDRMKANEEKEQEELANAQALDENGVPTGAAQLSQDGATSSSLQKIDKQWLTQSDIDHYAEDERRLQQLSGELQRVAASIARISTHQREIGMHLGLPDPNTVKFEVGERIEIQIGEGSKAGTWAKATVLGPGDRPNTWNVHVPTIKKGSKDMANVPAVALRKDEEKEKVATEPSEAKYEVGEQAQVQIAVGPLAGLWVRCSIRSKADLPDAYNIYVASAPPGHREIPSVPARVLRKAETKGLFTQYDMDGDGVLSSEEFKVAMREKANSVYEEAKEKKHSFAEGENVQVLIVEGENANKWVGCRIMGTGDLANSWNIFIPGAKVGFEYVQNIPEERLRRVGEGNETEAETEVRWKVIPEQADHEVLLQQGPYKDRWVPCEIRKKSDNGDSMTLWVPYGAADGKTLIPNILPDHVRLRRTCGPGYEEIFDADAPGYDHYDRPFNRKETAEECAADCNPRFSCRSFEWSPLVRECHLNKEGDPSLPGNGDYLFCRRKEVPKSAAALWKGPWLGQDIEYRIAEGEYNGTWHPCQIVGYGEKPDTYQIMASVEFLGLSERIKNVSGVPAEYLRFSEDQPLPTIGEFWEPPSGEEAQFRQEGNATQNESSTVQLTEEGSAATSTGDVAANASASNTTEQQAATSAAAAPAEKAAEEAAAPAAAAPAEESPDKKETRAALDADGIDGEVGESVEVVVGQGEHMGEWVPAVIQGYGSQPDTFNIKVVGVHGVDHFINDVKGIALRKANKTVVSEEDTTEYPSYSEGERAVIMMPMGHNASAAFSCSIKTKSPLKDIYDLEVPSFGDYPTVHARHLRKVVPSDATASTADDEMAISVQTVMSLIEGMTPDLLPVWSALMKEKKSLRLWIKQMEDWDSRCTLDERSKMVTSLQELSNKSRDAVAASVPEECSLGRWTKDGFDWEAVATCFQAATNTSRACASCPVRFLANAADKCASRCTPMLSQCRTAHGRASAKCQMAVGRCLDCLDLPSEDLTSCMKVPNAMNIMSAVSQLVKNTKGGGNLKLAATLRNAFDGPTFEQVDQMAKQALRAVLFSWERFTAREP